MSGKKNLILAFWTRHSVEPLEKFIASLRHIAFAGDVCIIVEDVSAETIQWLQARGVRVERAGRAAQPRMAAMSRRFYCYLDFLLNHFDAYANVMLADPSSTIFQSDPFGQGLPAEIVYATEHRLIGESAEDRHAMVQAYGEAVAHNIRDCAVSCGGVVLGTYAGILQYVFAMTNELASRTMPLTGGMDRGIHNYVVRMRPLRNAWLDPTGSLVAVLRQAPDDSVTTSEQGVLIGGKLLPVLHQWDQHDKVRDYIGAAPQFRNALLDAPPAPMAATPIGAAPRAIEGVDSVVAFYHRQRDAEFLTLFLASLRVAGHAGGIHCVGEFNEHELSLLSQFGGTPHHVAAIDPTIVENLAHFHISHVLDGLAADVSVRHDQVLVLETMQAVIVRDPFQAKTIGLSTFCEGPMRIGESDFNRQRLAHFAPSDDAWLDRPIVSSCVLRGKLEVVRVFYRKLFVEFTGRAELLETPKIVQGAMNKLCHSGGLEFPIIQHPNGAEVYFEFDPILLGVNTKQGIRIGGAVPAIVLNLFGASELIRSITASLGLETFAVKR